MIHPLVRDLFLDLGRHPAFQDAGRTAAVSGLTLTAKALYSVLLWQVANRPLILVVDGNKQAEALSEAIATFFSMLVGPEHPAPQLLPALDVLPLPKPLAPCRTLRTALPSAHMDACFEPRP